ncbi:arabinoxylan arabinofuranohydrolase [Microdochium nivale]|nr:arabinoxylan arabinofuranohydrolase [Microdochium nivale]
MAPLITHVYTADPSAHVFEGKLYIYPSHDVESGIPSNDNGDQYDMNDYRVFSIDTLSGIAKSSDDAAEPPKVTDHGAVLRTQDIPWVSKQLWAPDCAYNASTKEYILYFPARDKSPEARFRIGVAVGPSPTGPFTPDPEPIAGSFSIDPACFVDEDDEKKTAYLYFGGLWGGQLQCYQGAEDGSKFDGSQQGPQEPNSDSLPALHPKVGVLDSSMRQFTSPPRDLVLLAPETGKPIVSTDHARRFFEAAWTHKHNGTYYFSYSTGDTHFLAYATSDSPLGPFTYRGKILDPVLGWTTHHSIVKFEGRWWLFYHDCELSGGKNHLRNVKCREIFYDAEGGIVLEKP